eukprot:951801-Pleurochrysis_carterae.AAC.1
MALVGPSCDGPSSDHIMDNPKTLHGILQRKQRHDPQNAHRQRWRSHIQTDPRDSAGTGKDANDHFTSRAQAKRCMMRTTMAHNGQGHTGKTGDLQAASLILVVPSEILDRRLRNTASA